jgi:hypothetical protein
MKIKTNASPLKLERAAEGLQRAADVQRRPYTPDNPAEKEFLEQIDRAFLMMLDSLQEQISAILLEEKQ